MRSDFCRIKVNCHGRYFFLPPFEFMADLIRHAKKGFHYLPSRKHYYIGLTAIFYVDNVYALKMSRVGANEKKKNRARLIQ